MRHFKQLVCSGERFQDTVSHHEIGEDWEQQLKARKSTSQKENFRSDYRGGKVAPDKAHKLFGALLVVSFYQSFHREVNDAGKKMNHLRQHTEQLWQVSTGESDTCKYQKKD